jgi:hypothetical protein
MPYQVSGNLVVGIWAKKGGVWAKIMNRNVTLYQNAYSDAGPHTLNWTLSGDFDLGTGVQAVGLTVESHDGVSADVLDFVSLAWQGVATSGTRSATPNNEKSTVTVSPQ